MSTVIRVDTQAGRAHAQRNSRLLKEVCPNRMPPPARPSSNNNKAAMMMNAEPLHKRTSTLGISPKPIPQATPNLHLGMFEIGKPLGKGKFGRVYLARHRDSGFVCALKVLDKGEIRREGAEVHVRREIEVHSNLRHPGVVGFYGWFHDSRRIFLILEFVRGGELYKSLRRERRFPERKAAKYAAQVAQSLNYLHSKNIMHRDIKPENILVGIHGELKLADFGYSVHAPSNRRDTLCGTLDYLPPEMLTSTKVKYSKAVDQWTLGVLTYEFLAGEAPFEDSQVMTQRRIVKCDMKPLPASVSAEAKDFVHSLLVLDSTKRLPLAEVQNHPWILKNCR